MSVFFTKDIFWELFKVASGGSSTEITEVLDSIVKSDRTIVSNYFSSVVDQIAHTTDDYFRIRELFIDLVASHRAITTQSRSLNDPFLLTNTQLDELFRSFGYPHSVILRDFDENPLLNKVNLFLDLVNLYKIKGTPQAIFEVLQYYGMTELDIYELWLMKKKNLQDVVRLRFDGRWVAGSTIFNPSKLDFSYQSLTSGDPHWLYKEEQIWQLYDLNKINLPSISPYFVVMPIISFGAESAMFIRYVQDLYEKWYYTRELPAQDCEVSELGDVRSLLEVYLAAVYIFNLNFSTGYKGDAFLCYDGTNDIVAEPTKIIDEYNTILERPITRYNKPFKLREYYDIFNRETPRHFLQNVSDAGYLLNLISSEFKNKLDNETRLDNDTLKKLMKDMGVWVRNNFGFGFINTGFLTFGISGLFDDLKPIINFFKPYRARLIIVENIQFKNWLEDSIIVEDSLDPIIVDQITHDFMTADSIPCCDLDHNNEPESVCIDTTAGTFYSRDTYDCGSYHDIGAVDDIGKELFVDIEQDLYTSAICLPNKDQIDNEGAVLIEQTEIPYGDLSDPPPDMTSTMWPITLLEGDPTNTDATAAMHVYQISGFQDYDVTGIFDCVSGFDHVYIKEEIIAGYLRIRTSDPSGGYLRTRHTGGTGKIILRLPL